MTEPQRYLAEEVAEDHAGGIITRREAMRRLGLLGVAGGAAAAMLAADTAQAEATTAPATRRRRHGGTAELEFDPIATPIGRTEVVSFQCYVSEPLSEESRYCFVLDSWFRDWVLVRKEDVVASIAGSTRANGKSVVWVQSQAEVEKKNGDTTSVEEAAVAAALDEARADTGATQPPPSRAPK